MQIDYTINDDIVAITDCPQKVFKKNDLFVANSIIKGCKHYPILVDIGDKTSGSGCPTCRQIFSSSIRYSIAHNFKKLDNLVNIEELTEVLNQPAFQ